MKIKYNPDKLFQPNIEEIKYLRRNNNSNIIYNNTESNLPHSLDLNFYSKEAEIVLTGEVPLIKFPSLSRLEFIRHGFSTRLGGISEDCLQTMNLSYSRGDNPKHVKENFRRICKELKIQEKDLVCSDQVHKTKIKTVKEVHRGNYLSGNLNAFKGVDGLITNVNDLPLVTFYADCVPLYFVDPVHKAIGLSHSGWRGTVLKIGKSTIKAMKQEFNTKAEDLIVAVGPSICRDCYEVSEDVAEEFKQVFPLEKASAILEKKSNGKYQLDLWLANQYILLEAGVLKENISNSNICTCCNSSLFYSHRASGGNRGNLAAFLSLC